MCVLPTDVHHVQYTGFPELLLHTAYLQENSYWYKYLNRNPSFLNQMEDEMKMAYKLTTKDRIDKIKDTLSFAQSFIDIIN